MMKKTRFIDTILHINPKCNFVFVVIDNNVSYKHFEISKCEHFLYIKLNVKPEYDWSHSYLNFEQIFKCVEENT